MLVLKILLGAFSAILIVAMYAAAWQEENGGDFWDDNNPSGFHRFVPPTFATAVLMFGNYAAWTLFSLHAFNAAG